MNALVQPGNRIAILGPSGAGKTLLLRALARLDPLDEGNILWQGEVVRGDAVPHFRARVMYLQQRPSLFDGDIEANLRAPYALTVHRDKRFDRDRVIHLLERLGRNASFLEKSHRDLSGGEAQVAALLRAVQLDPAILLLDEPTASLDHESVHAIETLLDAWYAEAPTARSLVWVTHQADQAARVAELRWSMVAGRLTTEP